MRVVRVYHAGRDAAHRARERALAVLGVDLTLVVPRHWPDAGAQEELTSEPFDVVEVDVRRAGDVNRHSLVDPRAAAELLDRIAPDVVDLHEEPFSLVARQWLNATDKPAVLYTAQNIDKRFPPPFAQYERAALRRVAGVYPCSRQAASVVRGKGFAGLVRVLPLGVDDRFRPDDQRADNDQVRLVLAGRLVPEKGVLDAVRVLAEVAARRTAHLLVAGSGPEEVPARALADHLGVGDRLTFLGWRSPDELAEIYRSSHVLLVPSRASETWVEQFGRIIVEAQASGAVVAGYASGAIPEVGGAAALLVPEGDVAALATAVVGVLGDPARYAALRTAGVTHAAGMTWASVARHQVAFYEDVLAAPVPRVACPRSPSARRARARQEFGPPATLPGGVQRPFAVPLLRRDTAVSRAGARLLDTAAELVSRGVR